MSSLDDVMSKGTKGEQGINAGNKRRDRKTLLQRKAVNPLWQ